jgi:lysine 6-dehydrogenase
MKNVIVLGAGMVGSVMVADLNLDFNVTVADISQKNLDPLKGLHGITTLQLDVSNDAELQKAVEGFDLVVGAVPGFLGYETLKKVISLGKNVVDISFFPENSLDLHELALSKGVTAVVDFGVAPGMMHFILGYHNKTMQIDSFTCYVGGLPVERTYPYEYKAPFSPIDVIEEYTRPARLVENGKVIIKPALSEPELLYFKEIGTLEAFNTDGLRTLINTMNIKNMKEKTLRYPGHIEKIKLLKDSGFFSEKIIEINGQTIRPIDITNNVLFDKWKLNPEDDELTVMKIIIEGTSKGKKTVLEYDMFDRRDKITGFSSMARTTGLACTGAVRLVLDGKYDRKGISPPEYLGEHKDCYEYIMKFMKSRNINYNFTEIKDQ